MKAGHSIACFVCSMAWVCSVSHVKNGTLKHPQTSLTLFSLPHTKRKCLMTHVLGAHVQVWSAKKWLGQNSDLPDHLLQPCTPSARVSLQLYFIKFSCKSGLFHVNTLPTCPTAQNIMHGTATEE